MNTNQKKVVNYFSSIGSRLSYDFILWGSKHLGFYPSGKTDITEREAQICLQDLVANSIDLVNDQNILDAGCGEGIVSTYIAKKYGVNVFGITIVPFEVNKAQKRAESCGVNNKTNYQIMDYSAMSFPNNYFDAIYTTESLSHSPDIHQTLREFFRVLKPGGKIAFFEYTLAADDQLSTWEKKMSDLTIENTAMMGLKSFRHDQFPKTIEGVGFKHVKEKNISQNMLPSFHRVYRFLFLPYLIVRFFRLQRFFPNLTGVCEYYKMAEKGLARYCLFTGNKPI